jgi:hypothetical protein
MWSRRDNPVPSAHVHDGDESVRGGGLLTQERPIRLSDIDRVLEESAGIERAGDDAPVRAWRDELSFVLEALAYAQTVLGADVGILRRCLTTGAAEQQRLVQDLPRAMASLPWGDGWSAPPGMDAASPMTVEGDVFTRSDLLMSAHQQMAYTDLSSRPDVTRVLRSVLVQLTNLAQRQDAVDARLQQVRAAIVRQYRDGAPPTRDWLG